MPEIDYRHSGRIDPRFKSEPQRSFELACEDLAMENVTASSENINKHVINRLHSLALLENQQRAEAGVQNA